MSKDTEIIRRRFNPEININTILTALILAALMFIGRSVINGREDIIKLSMEQNKLSELIKTALPRVEFEFRIREIEVKLESIKSKNNELEIELTKIKRLFIVKPSN